jgi:glycosyltransferase involved in cell wall biosynthesis
MAETHGHHSPHSGYGRLARYLPGAAVIRYVIDHPTLLHSTVVDGRAIACIQVNGRDLAWPVLDPVVRRLLGQRHWTPLKAMLGEAALRAMMTGSSRRLYHLAYGDDQFGILGSLGWPRRCKLVATFHQPPDVLWTYFKGDRTLRRLDGALVFTEHQREVFERLLGPERVVPVTCGVDATYWHPAPKPSPAARPTVLSVGSWLRDFETMRKVAEGLQTVLGYEVRVVIVTAPEKAVSFDGCAGVQVLSGISEAELRRLYQTADVTVLPLLDGTVNNAMVESLACGTPVVVSDVARTWRQPCESGVIRVPAGDPEAIIDAVKTILEAPDPALWSRAARGEAEALDWPLVASRHAEAYRHLLG